MSEVNLDLPYRLKPYLRMDSDTGEVIARLSDVTVEQIRHVVREELLATSATPEQLLMGMRRLMACIRHGDGETCELCQEDT